MLGSIGRSDLLQICEHGLFAGGVACMSRKRIGAIEFRARDPLDVGLVVGDELGRRQGQEIVDKCIWFITMPSEHPSPSLDPFSFYG